jgi:hypothetical protein
VEVEHPDGNVYVQLRLPEDLRDRTLSQAEAAAKRALVRIFPYQCRKLLEDQQTFVPEQAEEFWVRFQCLVNGDGVEGHETRLKKPIRRRLRGHCCTGCAQSLLACGTPGPGKLVPRSASACASAGTDGGLLASISRHKGIREFRRRSRFWPYAKSR